MRRPYFWLAAAGLFLLPWSACNRSSTVGDGGENGSGDGGNSGPRDFAYYDGKLTGCHDLSVCLGACGGDHNCEQDCYAASSTQAQSLYHDMLDCEDVACPHMVTTDPCETHNPDYLTTCLACKNKSLMGSGKCVAQAQVCDNDY